MSNVQTATPWGELSPAQKTTRSRAKQLLIRQAQREPLKPARLAVLLALIDCWQPDAPLFPRVDLTIAPKARVSPATAYTCLSELRALGIIVWGQRRGEHGHNQSSRYWFTDDFFRRAKLAPVPHPYSKDWSPSGSSNSLQTGPSSSLDRLSESAPLDLTENGRERPRRGAAPRPVFVPKDLREYAELREVHAAAHRQHYPDGDPGSIRADARAAVASELRSLAARAEAYARSKDRYDLDPDALRLDLTRRIVRAYLAQDRPWLLERCHPLGGLWAGDGKPCDLATLGARELERWCGALEDGYDRPSPRPTPPPAPEEPPHVETAEEAEEARQACAELRAVTAAFSETAPALTPRPVSHVRPPPLPVQTRDELARIDAEARTESLARARARRRLAPRGGRATLGARPRERAATLAALLAPADTTHAGPMPEATPARRAPLLREVRHTDRRWTAAPSSTAAAAGHTHRESHPTSHTRRRTRRFEP